MDTLTENLEALHRRGELAAVHPDAAARFFTRGVPTPAEEAWKYTNLGALAKRPFAPAGAPDRATVDESMLRGLSLASSLPPHAVVVNGGLRADLGTLETLPAGVTVVVETGVAAGAGEPSPALTELNAAFGEETLVVTIAPGTAAGDPIHLVFVGASTEGHVLRLPRVQIRAGRNSSVHVIEEYVGVERDTGFTNALTTVVLEQGATVHHHRLQREAAGASHVGRVAVEAATDSAYHSNAVAIGAELARVDIDVTLAARGARCALNGLFVADGTQHVDHHTCIDHAAEDTHSEELYRGIVDDRARGVFNGRVVVRQDAQHISARQASNNLLLSRQAEIDTKPELEIYADDVTCAHGATVGELDRQALFYLRSRGVPEAEARALLTHAFAEAVIESIPVAGVRDWLEERFLGSTALAELREALR